MHGGAFGSGAPKGNQNALKHGRYTKRIKEVGKSSRETLKKVKGIIAELLKCHQ
jgi:uncharacterized protein YjcR